MKYVIPKYHVEIFGDNTPRSVEEIYQTIFSDNRTDAIESWWRDNLDSKFVTIAHVSEFINYWEYNDYDKKLLVASIKKNGILYPVVAIKLIEGKYKDKLSIVEGHHRIGAAKQFGIEKIKVFILEQT